MVSSFRSPMSSKGPNGHKRFRPSATPVNPVDITMLQFGDRQAQANTLLTMLKTPADAAALIINYLSEEPDADWDSAVLAMIDVRKRVNVPCFVITNLPEGAPHRVRELLLANDVVPLQGMEDAMSCIGQAARATQGIAGA